MIDPRAFLAALTAADVRFVTGVPDSLLKDVCACITRCTAPGQHVIATSEGSAVALAIGHHLVTGRPALVYLQNSGLGNLINPIASLADPAVYAIPMILMIGWRAEVLADGRSAADEPQHITQGRITLGQLDLLGIPHAVIDEASDITQVIGELTRQALARSGPVALVVRKGTFDAFRLEANPPDPSKLSREGAIAAVLDALPSDTPVVATTGMASRELFELRKSTGTGHARDFLTVGGMGHASQIAAGIAMALPGTRVACLDGDGAVLMHMGALAINADCRNLLHVILNNQAHDSVGGQPTKGGVVDFTQIASACGYGSVASASSPAEIAAAIAAALRADRAALVVVACRTGARPDLGRPTRRPPENKADFMEFLRKFA